MNTLKYKRSDSFQELSTQIKNQTGFTRQSLHSTKPLKEEVA